MDVPVRLPGRAVRIGSLWYLVVPLVTIGLLTFLPFLHAAVRLRWRWVWLAAVAFAVVAVGALAVSGRPDRTTTGAVDAVVVVAVLASMVVGITLLTGLRREVYHLTSPAESTTTSAPPATPPTTPTDDPAVRQVLRARTRRAQARDLASADPLMARELRVGRPDLPGDYDDGGLVDIASAPATVIAQVLDLTPDQAAEIIAVRDAAMTDLPVPTWDRIRDRAILIR